MQSWNFGLQRELGKNMVMEVRYTGNHGTDLWRQIALNEANIYENGFLKSWNIAANNLQIARQTNPSSSNFGDQGLPGQVPVGIFQTIYGRTSSSTGALLSDRRTRPGGTPASSRTPIPT